jgi:hypothetical protein
VHKDQKDKTATGTYVLHINSERKQGGELTFEWFSKSKSGMSSVEGMEFVTKNNKL